MLFKGTQVTITSGKYAGYIGYVDHETEKHPLSSKRRYCVSVQTGIGWQRLLLNEGSFKIQ